LAIVVPNNNNNNDDETAAAAAGACTTTTNMMMMMKRWCRANICWSTLVPSLPSVRTRSTVRHASTTTTRENNPDHRLLAAAVDDDDAVGLPVLIDLSNSSSFARSAGHTRRHRSFLDTYVQQIIDHLTLKVANVKVAIEGGGAAVDGGGSVVLEMETMVLHSLGRTTTTTCRLVATTFDRFLALSFAVAIRGRKQTSLVW
jgi:hypothetical protein